MDTTRAESVLLQRLRDAVVPQLSAEQLRQQQISWIIGQTDQDRPITRAEAEAVIERMHGQATLAESR